MTKEEAINSFKKSNELTKINIEVHRHIMDTSEIRELEWYIERDKMAIEALEQEPCEDCISRTEAINVFPDLLPNFGYNTKCIKEILQDLPSVQPKADQEPKTVLYSGDGYADGYMVYDMAVCPNCGYIYEEVDKDWKEPYCPHCGQALKWESEG